MASGYELGNLTVAKDALDERPDVFLSFAAAVRDHGSA